MKNSKNSITAYFNLNKESNGKNNPVTHLDVKFFDVNIKIQLKGKKFDTAFEIFQLLNAVYTNYLYDNIECIYKVNESSK